MILPDESVARLRLALAEARRNGAEMLSVAFPPLPFSAFENLTLAPSPALLFFFENAKKNSAEAAFDFAKNPELFTFPAFQNLADAFPKTRRELSLSPDEADVPAPKIFTAGTFDGAKSAPVAALPPWQISRDAHATRVCAHVFLNRGNTRTAETLLADYARLQQLAAQTFSEKPDAFPEISATKEIGGDAYFTRAANAISQIESGNFEKIVLSRARDFSFSGKTAFPSETLCAALRKRFLASGCTLFSARTNAENAYEKIVGATPEMLVRLENGKLETEALAGTVANVPGEEKIRAEQLLADAKERREHRLVVDFIAEKLRAQNLAPRFPATPQILALPNVIHLHTPIEADVPAGKVLLGKIVDALHPTPAMCGVPADSAKKFIVETESFPRENFAAPVGFLDAAGNGFFAVAIRCAKIFENKIRLYAGSGLVRGSVPEKEFSEIEAKISALANIFRK